MTTITFELDDVQYECQGVKGTIALGELHEDTLKACMVYGLRRKMQDTINSAAATARSAKATFDAQASVDEFYAKMKSGELGVRTGGGTTAADPVTVEARSIARKNRNTWPLAADRKAYADAKGDTEARNAVLDRVIEANPVIREIAQENVERVQSIKLTLPAKG